ncbi:MAG: hypothetical protein P0116_13980 [Candidatus Nitrosocosmicus sp.]|nr:hypothetical protein [Candidatus Nitrosocosmicus sp.]
MKAGYHTLKELRRNPGIYDKINSLGETARRELSKLFVELGIRVQVTGIGSLFMIHFLNEKTDSIENAVDAALCDRKLLINYNMALMAKHDIFFLPGKMGAFSNANDKKDVTKLVESTRRIFEQNKQ